MYWLSTLVVLLVAQARAQGSSNSCCDISERSAAELECVTKDAFDPMPVCCKGGSWGCKIDGNPPLGLRSCGVADFVDKVEDPNSELFDPICDSVCCNLSEKPTRAECDARNALDATPVCCKGGFWGCRIDGNEPLSLTCGPAGDIRNEPESEFLDPVCPSGCCNPFEKPTKADCDDRNVLDATPVCCRGGSWGCRAEGKEFLSLTCQMGDSLFELRNEPENEFLDPVCSEREPGFVYSEPAWWSTISDTFTGIRLERCRKREFPPLDGSQCARRPKACFWGQQECEGIGPYPQYRCDCNERKWECSDDFLACPVL